MKTQSKETLLQKLLGQNYKWWFLASFTFKVRTNYLLDTLFAIVGGVIQFIGAILVWIITIRSGAPLSLSQILTYFIIGKIFAQFCNSIVQHDLADDIKDGKLINKLLNTSDLFGQYFWRSFGGDIFYSFWNIIALSFIALFFWQNIIWVSWVNFILAVLLIIFSRQVLFYYQILTGSLAFWSTEANRILRTTNYISIFCSGLLFPLDLINETKFLQFTPFALFYYHPMQIYLGKYSPIETILVFLGGIFWCIILYFLAKLVFKMGLKKNESVGL